MLISQGLFGNHFLNMANCARKQMFERSAYQNLGTQDVLEIKFSNASLGIQKLVLEHWS